MEEITNCTGICNLNQIPLRVYNRARVDFSVSVTQWEVCASCTSALFPEKNKVTWPSHNPKHHSIWMTTPPERQHPPIEPLATRRTRGDAIYSCIPHVVRRPQPVFCEDVTATGRRGNTTSFTSRSPCCGADTDWPRLYCAWTCVVLFLKEGRRKYYCMGGLAINGIKQELDKLIMSCRSPVGSLN